MDEPWYIYLIAFGGAFLAGAINTLAGSGSVITLSILTELIGLPGNLANGTNRIGVLFNGLGSSYGFFRGGKLKLDESRYIIISSVIGAVVGAAIALSISNEQFMGIFRFLMITMLIVILVKPGRWLKKERALSILPYPVLIFLYFLLGVYGGLIQMGMGIFFLAVAVLLDGYPIIEANAVKVAVVTIFTVLVLAMFQYRGLVSWPIGLLMGAGQFIGGWGTARLASGYPGAEKWAYGLLLLIVIASILSLFGVFGM